MLVVSRRSATVRKNRSAPKATKLAGSRTAVGILFIRSNETLGDASGVPHLYVSGRDGALLRLASRMRKGCRFPLKLTVPARPFPAENPLSLWDNQSIQSLAYSGKIIMKPHRVSAFVALLSMLWVGAAPAWGVSKEMVQLQTQVQQ